MILPSLKIKGFSLPTCIVQGGMGTGVSLAELAGAVSNNGGLGTISSAGLRTIVSNRGRKQVDTYTATRIEIETTRILCGVKPIAMNIMCALVQDYEASVRASIDGGINAIVSGAGLPLGLPGIKIPGETALIPIVSSARALEIIIKRWEKIGYRPDAVVLEGPLAGGHLGFKMIEVDDPNFTLEKLLPAVLDVTSKHGNFPVIAAGGIYTHSDICKFLHMGASAVQIGTRFLTTFESSASLAYKQAVVSARIDDIKVVAYPGSLPASPCGLPFRVLTSSPMLREDAREPKCDRGYVLQRGQDGGRFTECQASPRNPNCKAFLCICNGLLASAGCAPKEPALYTVGTNAFRVDRIMSVAELMTELKGE